jgi:hypothetical protein
MTRPMQRSIVTALVVVAGTLSACSGDDDPPVTTAAAEPSGATTGDDGASPSTADPSPTTAPASTASTDDSVTAPSLAATTVPTPTTTPNAVISVVNQPGEGEFEGALEDVTDIGCAAGEGTWTSSGTVTNPTDAPASYRIFVSFLDGTGETLALIETNLDAIEPGESSDFAVDFATDAADLTCVLRVERRAA